MIEFEYKGKIYYTENLDKKLKRLKIKSRDEIKIITENSSHGQKKQENPADNDLAYYPHIYLWDDTDNSIINMLFPYTEQPTIDFIINNIPYVIYDNKIKTGWGPKYTKDYFISHIHILKQEPKYPINIINGLPELSNTSLNNNTIII